MICILFAFTSVMAGIASLWLWILLMAGNVCRSKEQQKAEDDRQMEAVSSIGSR